MPPLPLPTTILIPLLPGAELSIVQAAIGAAALLGLLLLGIRLALWAACR